MTAWVRDLDWGASVTAAVVLLAAGVSKLRAPGLFASQVVAYDLVPRTIARLVGYLLPPVEILVGLTLIALPQVGGGPAAVLYALFAGATGVNLARGRTTLVCGCFGPTGRHRISAMHVGANSLAALCTGLAVIGKPAPSFAGAVAATSLALAGATLWAVRGLGPNTSERLSSGI